jgi:hypothetical protein
MKTGAFGFGFPLAYFAARGLEIEDVTLDVAPSSSPVSDFIEPFMDPFTASFLNRLANGDLDRFNTILIMRESPGAIFALHYGKELARKNMLPETAPELVAVNLIGASTPAVTAYNSKQLLYLCQKLGLAKGASQPGNFPDHCERLEALKQMQERSDISGAAAFEARQNTAKCNIGETSPQTAPTRQGKRRFALLGAPLGNAHLHELIDKNGALVFDQQGWDQTFSARKAMAENPFSARQPRDIFVAAVLSDLVKLNISDVVWQVDPHDDLWGWLMPTTRDAVDNAGMKFHDLGFLPRWPTDKDLIQVAERLKI